MKPLYRFYIANDSTPLYDSSATVEDNTEYVVKDVNNDAITRVDRPEYCTITAPIVKNGLFADPKKLLTRIAFYNAAGNDFRGGVLDCTAVSSFFISFSSKRRVIGISARGSSSDLPPVYIARQVYPIFSDDLKKEWKKESKQAFFRQSLKGKLKFVKDDYAYIMSSSLSSYHCVKIERSMNNGVTWAPFFEGYFRRTDARIVPEDNLIEVQLNTLDLYEAVLNGQDKEFDLIKLSPEINSLTLFKRPAIQIYSPGEKVISTFVSGVYWEQECDAISDDSALKNTHGFSARTYGYDIANIGTSSGPRVTLEYSATYGDYIGYYKDPAYANDILLSVDGSAASFLSVSFDNGTTAATVVRNKNNDTASQFAFDVTAPDGSNYPIYILREFISKTFYARIMHDLESVATKVSILNTEFFGNTRNYRYATPPDWESFGIEIKGSAEITSTATEYGQRQPGQYYKRPLLPPSRPGFYLPVSKSQWGDISYWLRQGNYLEELIDAKYRKKYTLKHAYPLHSCISVLLKQIASNVSFSNDLAHSGFFYDNRANLIAMSNSGLSNLHITPITNILKGAYDQPAQKCTIKLKDLFNLVRDLFNCYWYIDGNNLRIEHIRYFNNGLDYTGGINSTQPDLDVTLLTAPRIHKTWLLGQSEYKYELDDLPERYQFSWPDDVTEPFIGWPIEVKNDYVKKGEINEISVSKFVSDIDFMLLNPGSFSEDNIAVLAPDNNGALQYLNQNLGAIGDDFYTEYSLQNGQLSFLSLVPRYYRDNISGKDVIINKVKYQNTLALNVIRTKEQVINIPFVENLTENSLVKTGLGIGRVDAMELNLNSNIVKITLKHATE